MNALHTWAAHVGSNRLMRSSCCLSRCYRALSAMVRSKRARPASKTPASSINRTKDVLTARDYRNILREHIPNFHKAYRASNADHIATVYEKLFHVLIQKTPRIRRPILHAATVNEFHVPYAEAQLFATAIHTMFMAITTKARNVTSGSRQDAAVLRLVTAYKRAWGPAPDLNVEEKEEEEEEDAHVAPSQPSAGASSPPAPSWGSFISRFKKHDDEVNCTWPICKLPITLQSANLQSAHLQSVKLHHAHICLHTSDHECAHTCKHLNMRAGDAKASSTKRA